MRIQAIKGEEIGETETKLLIFFIKLQQDSTNGSFPQEHRINQESSNNDDRNIKKS